MQLGSVMLTGVSNCPHCGIAHPALTRAWHTDKPIYRADGAERSLWGLYFCTACGSAITAQGWPGRFTSNAEVVAIFPEPKEAHEDLPEVPRRFLQQAFETLHAPDAAAMLAGSAVDAMLKELGLTDGSLYVRIDEAVQQNLLTKGMADWAHSVRLGSNRPRHADRETPHVSQQEAETAVDFAEALGQFLFVLAARITRGIEKAQSTGPA